MDENLLQETESSGLSENETSFTAINKSQLDAIPKPESVQTHGGTVAERLKELVERDQQYRTKVDPERVKKTQKDPEEKKKFLGEMTLTDRVNKAAVQEMIEKGELQTAEHFNDAALIFQHGEVPDDFRIAFELSVEAVKRGMPPDRTLLKQAFDRYMIHKQLEGGLLPEETKQRFGTQTYTDSQGNQFKPELDGLATSEEKSILGIPLAEVEQVNVSTISPNSIVTTLHKKLNDLFPLDPESNLG